MCEIAVEQLSSIRDEIHPLLELHADELKPYSEFELSPDWDVYQSLEDDDSLVTFTVRDNEELVGYVIYVVRPSLHYNKSTFATMDVIYLNKEYRKSGIGKDLLIVAESILKEHYSVDMMTIHMKVRQAFEELALSCGYDKLEYLYTKRI